MRALHRPYLELMKCNNCDKLFNTDNDKQTYIEKYHITVPESLNVPELKNFQRQLKEGNKTFLKFKLKTVNLKTLGELLNSDDEYDPNMIQMILNLMGGLTLKVNHS